MDSVLAISVISENLSPIYRRMYELINSFATQQFRSFWLLLFLLVSVAKSWNLHKVLKNWPALSKFKPNLYTVCTYGNVFSSAITPYANEQKM